MNRVNAINRYRERTDAVRYARFELAASSVTEGRCHIEEICVCSALKSTKVGVFWRNLGGTAVLPSHTEGIEEPFLHLSERKC